MILAWDLFLRAPSQGSDQLGDLDLEVFGMLCACHLPVWVLGAWVAWPDGSAISIRHESPRTDCSYFLKGRGYLLVLPKKRGILIEKRASLAL